MAGANVPDSRSVSTAAYASVWSRGLSDRTGGQRHGIDAASADLRQRKRGMTDVGWVWWGCAETLEAARRVAKKATWLQRPRRKRQRASLMVGCRAVRLSLRVKRTDV